MKSTSKKCLMGKHYVMPGIDQVKAFSMKTCLVGSSGTAEWPKN